MEGLVIRVRLDRTEARRAAREHVADAAAMAAADATTAAAAVRNARAVLTAEEAAARARDELTDESNRRAVAAARARLEAVEMLTEAEVDAAHVNAEAADADADGKKKSIESMKGLIAQYLTFSNVAKVIGAVRGMWLAQREEIEKSVKGLADYRESVLGLASLKGNGSGRTTGETVEQLGFRTKTLQTKEAATAFQEGMMNTGQASIMGGFIKQDQFDKLMVHIGSMQAANPKITPDIIGNLGGIMPTLIGQPNVPAETAASRTAGILKTFELGSSNPGPAVAGFQKNSALIGPGLFQSPEQMAAVQSAFSATSPNESDTLTRQFVKGTVGGLTRMVGSPFEGSEKTAEYLKGLGATDQMDPVAIGKMVAADLKARTDAAAPEGHALNPMTYLVKHGYSDEQDRQAMMQFAKMVNTKAWEKTFEPRSTPDSAPTFAAAMAPSEQWKASDQTARNRAVGLAGDLKNATLGMGPEEYYDSLKRLAFERLKSRKETYGEYDATNKDWKWQPQLLAEVGSMMNEAGGKAGLPRTFAESRFSAAGHMAITSEATRAKYAYEYGTQVAERGGKVFDNAEILALLKRQAEATERMEARARSGASRRPPPRPPPLRQAPANFNARP